MRKKKEPHILGRAHSFAPRVAETIQMLVLRDYVRRNRRLPKIISVDNGADFRSKELEWFCKIYDIDLRFRSPGEPRGGAMIERLIGATEEEVFGVMEGNTRQMADPRLVTKSVNPFERAAWILRVETPIGKPPLGRPTAKFRERS